MELPRKTFNCNQQMNVYSKFSIKKAFRSEKFPTRLRDKASYVKLIFRSTKQNLIQFPTFRPEKTFPLTLVFVVNTQPIQLLSNIVSLVASNRISFYTLHRLCELQASLPKSRDLLGGDKEKPFENFFALVS